MMQRRPVHSRFHSAQHAILAACLVACGEERARLEALGYL
jgi:hypothetical protein